MTARYVVDSVALAALYYLLLFGPGLLLPRIVSAHRRGLRRVRAYTRTTGGETK